MAAKKMVIVGAPKAKAAPKKRAAPRKANPVKPAAKKAAPRHKLYHIQINLQSEAAMEQGHGWEDYLHATTETAAREIAHMVANAPKYRNASVRVIVK